MDFPQRLKEQLRDGKVIPFVGAGVSMAVREKDTTNFLFPSWRVLLERAAERLDNENKAPNAGIVRGFLEKDNPDYYKAAQQAHEGLAGALWIDLLKEQLDPLRERAEDKSLGLARTVWDLGSQLIITTNYDRVLRWASPQVEDLKIWDIEATAEQVAALGGELRSPTIWHLHGHIDNAASMILTPDGYKRFYPTTDGEPSYQAALTTLRTFLTTHTFLFIGFSMDDAYFGLQMKGILEIFQGATGPHYALIHESELSRAKSLDLPVDYITFAEFGDSLVDLVKNLRKSTETEETTHPEAEPVTPDIREPRPSEEGPTPSVRQPPILLDHDGWDYLDFELEISKGAGREYPLVAKSSEGEKSGKMNFPFDELALENQLLRLQNALLLSGTTQRRMPTAEEQTVQDFGQSLFEALFPDEVGRLYESSLSQARLQRKGLRLKLRIQAPELDVLPWEYLYNSAINEYVNLSKWTPIVRSPELSQMADPFPLDSPLKILGMIVNPQDRDPLDVDSEKQRLERATDVLRSQGRIELTWMEGNTWHDMQLAMRLGSWHIFHFIGHGGFDQVTDEGLILVESEEDGSSFPLRASQLARLLFDHFPLRLVLLNACQGARGSGRDISSSTAATLIRQGIPAVVAMQRDITDRAAIEFSHAFYEALVDGMPMDGAVSEARKAVTFAIDNSLEWGTPVLYMRSPVLFRFSWPIKSPGRDFRS